MKILILMGGKRVETKNDSYPLYMIEIERKMILEQQLEKCSALKPTAIICCVKRQDVDDFHIDKIICQTKLADCVIINNKTTGAICTALLASGKYNTEEELIVLAVDEILDVDFESILSSFRGQGLDCGLVSFPSSHPRYSFAKLDKRGLVCEVAEKRPISKNALVSFFYFKHGSDFVSSAEDVIRKDNPLNGSFYISQTICEMVLKQKKVGMYNVPAESFHPLKTEMQLFEYVQDVKSKHI